MKRERKLYLDVLRILATYAVILLHVTSKYIGTSDYRTLIAWDSLVRWAVPMFVMISGTLFLDPNKKISINQLWRKNIFRLITALFFWTIIYCAYEYLCNGTNIHMIKMYIITGYWHLWFIVMIIGLYIVTPILRPLTVSRHIIKYYLVLSFVAAIVVPTLRDIVIPNIDWLANREGITKLFETFGTMELSVLMGFTCYYILGYWLSVTNFRSGTRKLLYVLCLISFIVNLLGNEIMTGSQDSITTPFDSSFSVNVWFESIGLYVFAKYNLEKIEISHEGIKEAIKRISSYSFGIYLVHILLREILDKYFKVNATVISPIIMVPALSLAIFTIGYCVSALINKIPILKKYIV